MNWNQTGMPAAMVSRLGRREVSEFKSVLSDAQNHVMRPVDVEAMAEELAKSGGREFVEMVRELTASLANAQTEFENANRRYERLVADLAKRGISIGEPGDQATEKAPPREPKSILRGWTNGRSGIGNSARCWVEWYNIVRAKGKRGCTSS